MSRKKVASVIISIIVLLVVLVGVGLSYSVKGIDETTTLFPNLDAKDFERMTSGLNALEQPEADRGIKGLLETSYQPIIF